MNAVERTHANVGVTLWSDRIAAEYREMPGLSLTCAQMQRLWGLEPPVCQTVIQSLVAAGVLRKTLHGTYVAGDRLGQ